MKITVDPGRCDAHGVCAMTAPDIFGLDDDGYVDVLDATPDEEKAELVDEAVACCPTQALSVDHG